MDVEWIVIFTEEKKSQNKAFSPTTML